MHQQRHSARTELLDQEMAEKVVVLGEVAHVHHLRGTPGDPSRGVAAHLKLILMHSAWTLLAGGGGEQAAKSRNAISYEGSKSAKVHLLRRHENLESFGCL